MKIDGYEVFLLRLPTGQNLRTAIHNISEVHHVFVKISSEGVHGFGYAFTFSEHQAAAIHALLSDLGTVLQGADASPASVEILAQRHLNFIGDQGPSMLARSAADIAAWDLLSKRLGVPLHTVLGAESKPLDVYATGGWVTYSVKELVDEAQRFYADGYRRYKIKLGAGPHYAEDLARCIELRDNIPGDLEIMVDANQAWSRAVGLEAAHEFAGAGFRWFEEPIAADDIEGYIRMSAQTKVDVAAGETLHGLSSMVELTESGAIDVLMPDVMRVGGVTGFRRVLETVEALGVPVSSHTFTGVSAHVMALSRLGGPIEVIPTWWNQVFEEQPRVADGRIIPGQAPGAGSTPAAEALARWRE